MKLLRRFHYLFLILLTSAPIKMVFAAPILSFDNNTRSLVWSPAGSTSINVHRGDGSYVTTISQSDTAWQPASTGSYYLVFTNNSNWETWERSNSVNVMLEPPLMTTFDVGVSGMEFSWVLSTKTPVNVHRADGSYVTSVSSEETSWLASEPGKYYLVAALGSNWESWLSSKVLTTTKTNSDQTADQMLQDLTYDVYSGTALELFWKAPSVGVVNGYDILVNGQYSLTVDGPSFFTDSLNSTKAYHFEILANALDGSTVSGSILVPERDQQPSIISPEPTSDSATMPANLRFDQYSQNTVELFWDRPASNSGQMYYGIFRNGKLVGGTYGTSYFDSRLKEDVTYAYIVRTSLNGEESFSTQLLIRTDGGTPYSNQRALPNPDSPLGDRRITDVDDSTVNLDWHQTTNYFGAPPPNYRYLITRNGKAVSEKRGTSFVDNNLLPGTTYKYTVTAITDLDSRSDPAEYIATTSGTNPGILDLGGGLLPPDCLTANSEELTFCYSPANHELSSTYSDGVPHWNLKLPANNRHKIRRLEIANEVLVIVTEVSMPDGSTTWEFSTYNKHGNFLHTKSLALIEPKSTDQVVGDSIVSLSSVRGLLLGYHVISAEGNFNTLKLLDTDTGLSVTRRVFPGSSASQLSLDWAYGLELSNEILFTADGTEHHLTESLFADIYGLIQDFSPTNYLAVQELSEKLVSGGFISTVQTPFGMLPPDANWNVADTTQDLLNIYHCPEGGTAQPLQRTSKGTNLNYWYFSNCGFDTHSIHGTIGYRSLNTVNLGISSVNHEFVYDGYSVTQADGDKIELDGSHSFATHEQTGMGCTGRVDFSTYIYSLETVRIREGYNLTRLDNLQSTRRTGQFLRNDPSTINSIEGNSEIECSVETLEKVEGRVDAFVEGSYLNLDINWSQHIHKNADGSMQPTSTSILQVSSAVGSSIRHELTDLSNSLYTTTISGDAGTFVVEGD